MNTESTPKSVPFNSIYVDESENIRSSLPKIKEMAEHIKKHGLIEPLVVVNGGGNGKGNQEYRLLAGYRRHAALKLLKWGDKPINVVVRNEWNPLIMFGENVREGLNAIDTAQRMHDLHTGEYPAPPGSERREHSISEIAQASDTSESSVRTYLRIHERLCAKVRKAAIAHPDVPVRVLHQIALEGGKVVEYVKLEDGTLVNKVPKNYEGKSTKVKVWESNDDKQVRIFNEWKTRHESALDAGRTREARGEKAETEKDAYGFAREKLKGGKTSLLIRAAIKVLTTKKDEDGLAVARAEGLRFALGDLTRLPGLTKEELTDAIQALKEKEAAADEEGE